MVRQAVSLARILLMTFTNRAARKMLYRVEMLVKQKTCNLRGDTFHHIATRILPQYGDRLGIKPDYYDVTHA